MAPLRRLPRVAVEVLALIALHQPVTRPEIKPVRACRSGRPASTCCSTLG